MVANWFLGLCNSGLIHVMWQQNLNRSSWKTSCLLSSSVTSVNMIIMTSCAEFLVWGLTWGLFCELWSLLELERRILQDMGTGWFGSFINGTLLVFPSFNLFVFIEMILEKNVSTSTGPVETNGVFSGKGVKVIKDLLCKKSKHMLLSKDTLQLWGLSHKVLLVFWFQRIFRFAVQLAVYSSKRYIPANSSVAEF